MRDRALGSTIRMQFVSTNPDGGGAPVAPSSAFAASDIRIYKDGSASEKTTTNGITVTSPFDSITGLHLVEIDTSNSTGDAGFWASGSVYHVRLVTAKTVATYSVSGLLIGEFSLELQTADVRKFGGTAGTFTSGKPDVQAAASVSGAVGSVTGAVGSVTGNVGGNLNGNVVGSVASVTGNVGGNVSGNVSGSVGSVTGAVGSVTGSVGSVVGNVGGSVASVAGAVGSVTGNVGGDVSGKVLGGGSGTISGDGVRAASVTGAVGSVTGAVGSVVGAVALDSASVTAVQSGLALEATSQSIKTKTDNLPTDPADQSLIIAATDAVMARLGAPAGASVSADVAAVKSDTASLLSRLTANAATAIQNLYHMITGTGAASKYTVAALENAPAGGGGGDAEQDTLLEVQTTVNALALSLAGTSVTVTSRVSGSEITAYIGDDYKVRSGTELEITVSDTGGALHTKLAAIGTSNLYFGASLPRKDPGQITGTISSLNYASNVLTIAVEITACASGLTTGDYTYQIQSSQAHGGDFDDFVELEGTLVVKQRTVAVRG